MIDGSGHYVSEKVAATIRRLEETLVLSERQTTEQARVKELREALERIRTYGGDYTTDQTERKTLMDYLIGAVIGVSAFVFVCWLIFMAGAGRGFWRFQMSTIYKLRDGYGVCVGDVLTAG